MCVITQSLTWRKKMNQKKNYVYSSQFSYIDIVIELHNLYSSPSIIRVVKSRRMRWAGNVAQIGEKRNAYRILVGSQKERDH
jgi:hypothetical protein